jgi:dipeptidase E
MANVCISEVDMSVIKTVVAIGGGELRLKETLSIDKKIVELSNKMNPRALFIPTASGEPDGYIEAFNLIYGTELGCSTDVLKILTETPTGTKIKDKILSADIIYVGGGNTAKMMETWKSKHIDTYLVEAYNKGIILSGLSAGSICWFEYGHSDSFMEETGEYSVVKGLGILPGLHCPHYNERPEFDKLMASQEVPALAIDNNCAVVFQDSHYRVIKSVDSANAYIFTSNNCSVSKRVLNNIEFEPMENLRHKEW